MGDDRGAGVVLVVMAMAVLMVAATAGAGVVGVATARARASAAADLAALAAARDGDCDVAQRVAEANGAVLEKCTAEGEDHVVTVAVRLGGPGVVRAAARAGP